MEARVICHPSLHQHSKQEWNKDQCLFGGLERPPSQKIILPKDTWEGICSERLSVPLIAPLGDPPTPRPSGLPGGGTKPLLPNSGLDKKGKMIPAKTS